MEPVYLCAVLVCFFASEAGAVFVNSTDKGLTDDTFASSGFTFHPSITLRGFLDHNGEAMDPNCPPQPVPVSLPDPLPEGISKSLQSLDQLANSIINTKSLPGIVVSVTYRGNTLLTKGFGVSSKENNTVPLNGDTIFRIGSVSKVFAVLMLYQLYERGYVQSLDDPLVKYAPSFQIHNPFSKTHITLRQMASQMSGLPKVTPCGRKSGLNFCPINNSQMLEILSRQSLIHPPWTIPSYSDLAYSLLGRLLTEAFYPTMTYEEYVKNNILEPLGMRNTGFEINEVKSRMAVGYLPTGAVAPLIDLGWLGPAGQMYSTANDLNTLAQFFYRAAVVGDNDSVSNSVLSAALRREMMLPLFVNPDRQTGFGTPWEIMFYENYTVRTKLGAIFGYTTYFTFIPELQLSITTLLSGGTGAAYTPVTVYKSLLPALVSYLNQNQPPIPYPPNPEVYEGRYSAGSTTITIKSVNHQLLMNRSSSSLNLFLAYHQPLQMTITYPTSLLQCLTSEMNALLGEYVYFDPPDQSNQSPGFTIPGVFLSHFKRETDL